MSERIYINIIAINKDRNFEWIKFPHPSCPFTVRLKDIMNIPTKLTRDIFFMLTILMDDLG